MCLDKLFGKKPIIKVIPHPEEPQNLLATLENTDIYAVFDKWVRDWDVPVPYREEFWEAWHFILVPNLTYMGNRYPALTWPDRIEIDPQWANPGVLAHECCHVIWAGLREDEQVLFSVAYRLVLETDALLRFVFSQKPYMQMTLGQNNDREGHADCYRYLGGQMPAILKSYYPKLF